MDLFRNLPWKIKEPSMLDIGTDFIKEETIAQSYLFLNNFTREQTDEEKSEPPGCKKKNDGTGKQKQIINRYEKLSKLNVMQQKQCLKALLLLDSDQPISSYSFQEQQVITMYNNFKTVIQEENEQFLQFVEEEWTAKLSKRVGVLRKFFKDCGMRKRSKKFERIQEYPQFYTSLSTVPLSNNELPVHIEHGPCLLQLGSVFKLNIPDLEKNDDIRAHLLAPLNIEFSDQYLKPTKQCVSKDIYAEYLAENSVSNVVISMSSLKAIIDNYGPDYSNSWDIPVVVKKYEKNGEKFYVAYVDKPFPQKHISLADIDYSVRKGLLKRCFRSKNNFSYQTPQFIKDLFDANSKTTDNLKTNEHISHKKQNISVDSPLSPTSDNENTVGHGLKTNELISVRKQKINIYSLSPPVISNTKNTVGHGIKTNKSIAEKKQKINIDSPLSPTTSDNENTVGHGLKTNESMKKQKLNFDSFVIPTETSDSDEDDSLIICDEKTDDNLVSCDKKTKNSQINKPIESKTNDDLVNKETKTNDSSDSVNQTNESYMEVEKNTSEDEEMEHLDKTSDSSVSVNRTIDDHMEVEKELSDVEEEEHGTNGKTQIKTELNKMETRSSKKYNTKEHNVTYRLWNLKTEAENVLMKNCAKKKDIKILVRTKTDGYLVQPNGSFVSTNIVPKLEYQREHGAQILTKSELLRQWTTLYFNPFSNLLRVRIFPNGNKYVKVETLNLNKVTNECTRKQDFNPKENLGILYNVLSSLTSLSEEGNYILHHIPRQGPFAMLYKACDNSSDHNYKLNIIDLYKTENCSIVSQIKWIPIDTTLVLPYHEKSGHMPGLFPPNRQQNPTKQKCIGRGRGRGKKSGRGRGRPRKVIIDN